MRVGEPRGDLELRRRVRDNENAALAQHHVEVELARQALVEPERHVVQRDRLGIEIVRAHDRRVAPGVAAAEPALLDHRDARAAMVLREIVGGREAVAAPADHDEVVDRLRLRLAPGLRPPLMAAQALAQNRQGGIARAHRSAPIAARVRRAGMRQRIGAESGELLLTRGEAAEGLEIMRRELQAGLHRLLDVERVIADLRVIEDARARQCVVAAVAVPFEHGLNRRDAFAVRPVEREAHLLRPARPFAHREIEPRAEQLRVDPAAEDVADRLVDRTGRRAALPHDRARVAGSPSARAGSSSRSSRFRKYQ